MTYRITLALACGDRHVAHSLAEARLMMLLGWRFVALHGRSARTGGPDGSTRDHAASPAQNPLAQAHWKL